MNQPKQCSILIIAVKKGFYLVTLMVVMKNVLTLILFLIFLDQVLNYYAGGKLLQLQIGISCLHIVQIIRFFFINHIVIPFIHSFFCLFI